MHRFCGTYFLWDLQPHNFFKWPVFQIFEKEFSVYEVLRSRQKKEGFKLDSLIPKKTQVMKLVEETWLHTNPDRACVSYCSASSFHVIRTLKNLATDGDRTILCSIHQPSSEVFELFDDLCLLSDGLQVYYGPLPKAMEVRWLISHFKMTRPTSLIGDVLFKK